MFHLILCFILQRNFPKKKRTSNVLFDSKMIMFSTYKKKLQNKSKQKTPKFVIFSKNSGVIPQLPDCVAFICNCSPQRCWVKRFDHPIGIYMFYVFILVVQSQKKLIRHWMQSFNHFHVHQSPITLKGILLFSRPYTIVSLSNTLSSDFDVVTSPTR